MEEPGKRLGIFPGSPKHEIILVFARACFLNLYNNVIFYQFCFFAYSLNPVMLICYLATATTF